MMEMPTVALCDEKGNLVDGDAILYIYGKYMKERGKLLNNTVVTTVMSNFGLYKAFDEQGIGYAKTAVGDKYVYEYMTRTAVGSEENSPVISFSANIRIHRRWYPDQSEDDGSYDGEKSKR